MRMMNKIIKVLTLLLLIVPLLNFFNTTKVKASLEDTQTVQANDFQLDNSLNTGSVYEKYGQYFNLEDMVNYSGIERTEDYRIYYVLLTPKTDYQEFTVTEYNLTTDRYVQVKKYFKVDEVEFSNGGWKKYPVKYSSGSYTEINFGEGTKILTMRINLIIKSSISSSSYTNLSINYQSKNSTDNDAPKISAQYYTGVYTASGPEIRSYNSGTRIKKEVTLYFNDINLYDTTYYINDSNEGISIGSKTTLTLKGEEGKTTNYKIVSKDYFNQTSEFIVIIDRESPTYELTTDREAGFIKKNRILYTNGNVYLKINSSDDLSYFTISIDGNFSTKININPNTEYYYSYSDEHEYYIEIYDKSGNYSSFTFKIIKNAPSLNIDSLGIFDEGNGNLYFDKKTLKISNDSETFIFDSLLGLKKVTYTFPNQEPIEISGSLEIDTSQLEKGNFLELCVTDNLDNKKTYYLYFDGDKPIIEGILPNDNKISNSGYYNSSITLNFIDETSTGLSFFSHAQIYLNGELYVTTSESSYIIEDPRTRGENGVTEVYKIIAYDKANHTTEISFTLDGQAPTYTITSQGLNTIEINGILYYYLSEKRNFNIGFTKSNTDGYQIRLDNKVISLTSSYVFNIENYTLSDGMHTLSVLDKAGNVTNIYFLLEVENPEGTLTTTQGEFKKYENDDYLYTNGNVTFTWQEDGYTALINGQKYSKGTTISENGEYIIILTNVEKSSTYKFIINRDIPLLYQDSSFKTEFDNVGFFNEELTLYWDINKHLIQKVTVSVNDEIIIEYENSTTNTYSTTQFINGKYQLLNGNFKISLITKCGTENNYSFIIDNLAPEGELTTDREAGFIEKNEILYTNGNVIFSWEEENCTVICNKDGNEFTNYSIVKKSISFTTEGSYEIYIFDQSSNVNIYIFTIIKTASEGTLTTDREAGFIEKNGILYTNGNVTFTFDNNCTATLNGEEYQSGDIITSEDTYKIILCDFLGNASEYNFLIDITAPEGDLTTDRVDGFIEKNGILYTNTPVYFSWNEEDFIIKCHKNGSEFNDYVAISRKKISISDEGIYSIFLYDFLENESEITFIIKKSISNHSLSTDSENGFGFYDNIYYTNGNVTFSFENDCTATLNGEEYQSGDIITLENTYKIILCDFLGNKLSIDFIIDRSSYEDNLNYFLKNGNSTINHWWATKDNYIINNSQITNGNLLSFSNPNDALFFAINRENMLVDTGVWNGNGTIQYKNTSIFVSTIYNLDIENAIIGRTYWIYKSTDNENNLIIYFSESYLNDAIDTIAKNSIIEKNTFKSIIETPAPNQDIYLWYDNLHLIYFKNDFNFAKKTNNGIVKINGIISSYEYTFTTTGRYLIEEYDLAGNKTSYILILDKEEAVFNITDYNDNLKKEFTETLNISSSVNLIDQFKIYLKDNEDYYPILKIEYPTGEINYVYNKESFLITNSGEYTITALTTSGLKTTKTIYLSKEEMSISFTDTIKNDEKISFTIDIIKNSKLNKIQSILIQIIPEGETQFKTLSCDESSYSNEVSPSNYSYVFKQSGIYKITIQDNYGRVITKEYEFLRNAPQGYLKDANGNILSCVTAIFEDGALINELELVSTYKNVYLTWDNEYTAQIIYRNGEKISETYSKDYRIKDEGVYIIRLSNNDETPKYVDFAFKIDKTLPDANFYYLNDKAESIMISNDITNQPNFKLVWNEKYCTCEYYINSNSNKKISYYENDIIYNDTSIETEITYHFIVRDKAGNESIFTLVYDNKPVYVSIYSNNKLIGNNEKTNGVVKFVWTEKNCTATLNGKEYTSGTTISDNGRYVLEIVDKANNTKKYYVEINNSAIQFELRDLNYNLLDNKSYYNLPVMILVTNRNSNEINVLLNEEEYELGTIISENNSFKVYITDSYGNQVNISFTIDTIPAEISLTSTSGFIKNDNVLWTNSKVNVSWNEKNCITNVINLDDPSIFYIPYTSDFYISQNGFYKITVEDIAGNTSEICFIINKDEVSYQLEGVENKGITNQIVKLTIIDNFYKMEISYNGKTITSFDHYIEFNENYKYEITLYSKAGNKTIISFELDNIAPEGTLKTTQESGFIEKNGILYTNGNVTFIYTNTKYNSILRNVETNEEIVYTSNKTIKNNGKYEIVLYDPAGNFTTYSFVILKDEVPYSINKIYFQDGEILKEEIDSKNIVNTMVEFNYNYELASNIIIKKNEEILSTIHNITQNPETKIISILFEIEKEKHNKYEIVMTSLSGTITVVFFEIDAIAPEGLLETTQENGFVNYNEELWTYGTVSFSWTEKNCTAILRNLETNEEKNYTLSAYGITIQNNGKYEIILYDLAGNTSIYSFSINNLNVEYQIEGVANGKTTNQTVYINIINNYSHAIYKVNENEFSSNLYRIEFIDSAIYEIRLYSISQKELVITFQIDKIAPEGELTTDREGGFVNKDGILYTNENVYFTWNEFGCSAVLINNITNKNSTYYSGTQIKNSSSYTIILKDSNNNESRYNFIIDKELPSYEIIGYINSKNKTNQDISFIWDEEQEYTAYLNGELYENGSIINIDNNYEFIITNFLGTQDVYNFTRITAKPIVTLKTADDEIMENNTTTYKNVYLTWDNPTDIKYSVTLDGKTYYKNNLVKSIGMHIFEVTDELGNSTTISFTIDREEAIYEVVGVEKDGFTSNKVFATWDVTKNYIVTLNGENYEYATQIKNEGYYTFVFKTANGLESEFSFTIDKTIPIGTLIGVENGETTNGNVSFIWDENLNYTALLNDMPYKNNQIITSEGNYRLVLISRSNVSNVYLFTIDKTAPTFTIEGLNKDNYWSNTFVTISWFENDCTATINGEEYFNGTKIEENNHEYYFEISDSYGNKANYFFGIDTIAPEGELITDQEEGFIIYEEILRTYGNVTFNWDEENCTCYLDDEKYISGTIIKSQGVHYIRLIDEALNEKQYIFIIDFEKGNLVYTDENNNVLSKESSLLTASNVILKYDNSICNVLVDGETYEENYVLSKTKEYEITLIYLPTNYQTKYYLEINKTAPEGTLYGVNNNGITATNVMFTWESSNCTATLNGNNYIKGTQIKNNGEYEIVLTNKLGVSSIYNFEINKIYPSIIFKDLENNILDLKLDQVINYDVVLEWDNSYVCKINDEVFASNQTLFEEKDYSITIINPNNNLSSYYHFTIDKTAPILNVYVDEELIESGFKTNKSVVISWDINDCVLYYKRNNANENKNTSGLLTISNNGYYRLYVIDKAGNKTEFEFERNKYEISSDNIQATIFATDTNGNEIEEKIRFKNTYQNSLKFLINQEYNAKISYYDENELLVIEDYSGERIDKNNTYTLILNDIYGNETSFEFTVKIKTQKPESFLLHNIAVVGIVLIPVIAISSFVIIKFKNQNKNLFKAKKH